MNKIVLKCILAVCIIFVPFILVNYYITNYFIENGKYFYDYDEIILNILQFVFIVVAGFIIKNKNKNTILENSGVAKKYMLGSLIVFLIIAVLYITEIYQDIYFNITFSLNIEEAPLFLFVCWEQILNGKFFFELSLCIFICFTVKIRNLKVNKIPL